MAREHVDKGVKAQREFGATSMLPLSYSNLALIHSALGDLQRARACAEEALKLSQESKTRSYEGLAWMALGRVVGKADSAQIDVTEKHIRQGISILEDLKARGMFAQGYLFLGNCSLMRIRGIRRSRT